ncbi:MAG: dephospho-CoA kinase [Tissierellia bacterium]|nr:dephospho-CoA kinase [Tissierellia bacterium]
MMQNSKIIGITGGIASGKSTLCTLLSNMSYTIINTDNITHDLYTKGNKGYKKILEIFGEKILDKYRNIDRKKLGNIVFNDKKKMLQLEDLIHPLVMEEVLNKVEKTDEKIIFVEIPQLFEAYDKVTQYINFYEIWLIYVDEKEQLKRLIKRDNLSKEEAIKRINSQMSLEEKKLKADFLIENNGNIEDLELKLINKIKMETEKI